jgi:tripartite-type tricarboxylate transporter receptor subunit TctC
MLAKMTHVPYRGTGPALTDTLAGQTQVFFSSAATALPRRHIARVRSSGCPDNQALDRTLALRFDEASPKH